MRCPICGTENAPDSRFCGGCGKQMPPPSKLAPTAKISDDAPLAPPTRIAPSGGQVSYAPPAMPTPPPGSLQAGSPASIAPTIQRHAAPAQRSIVSHQSGPSMSFSPPPTRPLGLIALVLIVDLGLAASGAFLLAKGLATPEAKVAPAPPAPEQKSEVPLPSPAPATASVVAAPPVADTVEPTPPEAAPPAPAAKVVAKPDPKSSARRREDRKPDKSTGPVTSPGSSSGAPATPHAAPPVVSTEAELDAQAARSRGAFKRCHEEAGTVTGSIVIAFEVLADGRVAHAAPVENTTGNGPLAFCLVTTIGAWKLSPHNGAPLAFVRPFSYP